jgi:4-hydroxy-3-polyprenylbenzoate decarboxylase
MGNYVVGITGASGACYGRRVVRALLDMDHNVHLVVSEPGRRVLKQELGFELPRDSDRLRSPGCGSGSLILHDSADVGASIASGSFPVDGMVVVPCSMATVAAIAGGASRNLIERAADVTIKEGRRLVLVPRETPLSPIHLENMLRLARLGVRVVPAMPAFYHQPSSIEDLVDFVAGRALAALGLENSLCPVWLDPVGPTGNGLNRKEASRVQSETERT